jgi:hypothetical protein
LLYGRFQSVYGEGHHRSFTADVADIRPEDMITKIQVFPALYYSLMELIIFQHKAGKKSGLYPR